MSNLPKFNEDNFAHFVTTKTHHGQKFFWDDRICKIFFDLYGHVLIPNHTHLLLRPKKLVLPPRGSSDCLNPSKTPTPGLGTTPATREYTISEIMQSIKRSSARLINQKYPKVGFKWQPGFYDFNIYSEKKLIEKLNYIHNNPVKHNIVKSVNKNTDKQDLSATRYKI